MRIGVLAVQGSFSLHCKALERLGALPVEVRYPAQLEGLEGIIVPGGESTTFRIVLEATGLGKPLLQALRAGLPVMGTCAGAIMLGRGDGPPQPRWGLIDVELVRNAYGRQVDSFIAMLDINGMTSPFPGVFIRAPRLGSVGKTARVLAQLNGEPVMARQGKVLVTAFHPELASDDRVHRLFLREVCQGS